MAGLNFFESFFSKIYAVINDIAKSLLLVSLQDNMYKHSVLTQMNPCLVFA